ncbi:MAG: putative sensor protein [Frankiales bacterium]|nr:putative sensor protein [Frankiales bacterium]
MSNDPAASSAVPDTGDDLSSTPAVDAVREPGRLAAVADSGLLDLAQQDSWDALTALASRLLQAPMAFLTVVDEATSSWLSTCGVDTSGAERPGGPVASSFCQYVIADRAPFAVSDASIHPRTRDNPAVTETGVRAWAGFPLVDRDGHALGSFCVMDSVARSWSDDDLTTLGVLARAASSQVSLFGAVRAEARGQAELRASQQAEVRAQARLDQLAGVTLGLLAASSLSALTDIIITEALPVLGVDGGAVLVREGDGFRLAASGRLHERVQSIYGELPLDSPLPACHVARTGETLVLANREAGLAFHPVLEQVYADTERPSWAFLPLRLGDTVLGSLAVAWAEERDQVPEDEIALVAVFAAQCTQALARIRADEQQRAVAVQLQRLSETLQRSLLSQPAQGTTDMTVAVRYLPSIESAQVGGDWYDVHPAGSSTLVSVGDVAGHDRNAAAGMAALRNVLRGLAVHSDASPADLLRDLDRAVDRLDLDLLATALAGRVEPHPDPDRHRALQLRWASAGHLPPLVRLADGTVRVLDDESDPLLGVAPDRPRTERLTELPEGSLLLLYTDGLVERRGESISAGLARLAEVLSQVGGGDVEQVSDLLLARMLPQAPDDDVALLVLRP